MKVCEKNRATVTCIKAEIHVREEKTCSNSVIGLSSNVACLRVKFQSLNQLFTRTIAEDYYR